MRLLNYRRLATDMEHWIAGATHPDDCYDVLD